MKASGTDSQDLDPYVPQTVAVSNQMTYLESTKTYPHLNCKRAMGLGITQIILGAVCGILQIIATYLGVHYINGAGYSVVCVAIIAGAFGIASAKRKTRCPIVTCLVMSILAAVASFFLVGVAVVEAVFYPTSVPIQLAVVGLVEFIVAILASVLCCATFAKPGLQRVVPVQFVAGQPVIITPNPQGALVVEGYPSYSMQEGGYSMQQGGNNTTWHSDAPPAYEPPPITA